MRTVLAFIALATATPLLAQQAGVPGTLNKAAITAGTYKVDTAHTQVTWKLNHLGFSMLEGQFGASGGTLVVDPARPAAAKLDVTFAIDQLSVTSTAFANHLKSKDFFDVANHPTARFVSSGVTVAGNNATINGNLTIKGITRPVVLKANFIGAGANPMSKKTNFGFRATTTIKRSDFGVGMAAPAVSDAVDLTINAAFSA